MNSLEVQFIPESRGAISARELWEETGLKGLQFLVTHQDLNDFGGEIHYVVLCADQIDEPKMVEVERQKTFYWLEPSAHFQTMWKNTVRSRQTYLTKNTALPLPNSI